ncbi:SDR family NAD(P)-dependent oxidoreductase [Sarcina ventriculi]|uniref:SDR family NAD(P)-dependent oxidoreductase n=1 Tax=Sarcina ventriculi TaxID=1267 RepID=UPI001C125ED4|nr:SDR family oxidoreductase [Sarcina ventriculi]MBU5323066.1 SDR family oxidoreductase [Sarcina ventriculi]
MKTALITGASFGLGFEFADIFAKEKYNLVIVARNKKKLEDVALELRKKYSIEVTIIVADLSNVNSPKRIYDEISEKGIKIDVLVNNAGSGKYGFFADSQDASSIDMINLNITSVTLLTKYFLTDMVKRHCGKILIVSSIGAFQPNPFGSVYGATKAYELLLAESLSGELINSGVTISALCPGPTKTEFATRAGKKDAKFAMDARTVALEGYKGMMQGKLIIIPSIKYKIEVFLAKLLPAKIIASYVGKWQQSLKN